MKTLLPPLAITAAALFTGLAEAGNPAAPIKGGTCLSESSGTNRPSYPGAGALWNCGEFGQKLTVEQIYAKGFRVVAVYTPLFNGERLIVTNYTMIIEEQK